MAESKRGTGVAAVLAVLAAVGIGFVAFSAFPSGVVSTVTATEVAGPKPLLGYLSAQFLSCSITTATCTATLVNTSTTPLGLTGCAMNLIMSKSGNFTTVHTVNGTAGGPALSGIAAHSSVEATCTMPESEMGNQTSGSIATGTFGMKLLASWYQYGAGTETNVGFQGTWA